MDSESTYEEFRACLSDLERVNAWTLGYRPTYDFLRRVWDSRTSRDPLEIVDVGFGGGGLLRNVEWWARKQKVAVVLTGIDMNPHAARAASEQTARESKINWVTANALTWQPSRPVDIVLCSLFTHHLESAAIVEFLRWCEKTVQRGWFMNDLYRSERASNLFAAAAKAARLHPFVQHDGPVSIRRAFREDDWFRYLNEAGVSGAKIVKWFPSRLCLERLR